MGVTIREPLHLTSPTRSELHDAVLTPDTPGPHRVRVSSRGRRTHVDESVMTPGEHCLIELWPEPELRAGELFLYDGIGGTS